MSVRDAIEQIANQLPVAVYLVAESGRFLYANDRLRKLLDIPVGDISGVDISDFYANRSDRDRLVAKVQKLGELSKEPVTFVSGRRNVHVQMSCNPIRDDGQLLGYLGVVIEMTEESEYHSVFDAHVRSGVYRVDENDYLTQANLTFAKIHGYASVNEVRGRPVTDFYANPAEATQIRQEIVKEKEVNRRKIFLKGKDGRPFKAWLTAVGFLDRNGQYAGRAGVIEDRSQEEQYERLLDDIPVGFYMIEHRNGKDEVVACNQEFAKIFELPSSKDMIGKNVTDFHDSPDDTARLMEKIAEAARNNSTVLGEQFNIRTALKNKKTIEVNARPQMDDGGRVVGRTGAIRDITKEVEMRDRITTLTNDIGAVLHTFRHTLTQLTHNISAVADVLAKSLHSPVKPQTPEDLEERIRPSLQELASSVDALLSAVKHVTHGVPLSWSDQESLQRVVNVLKLYRSKPKAHWRDLWSSGAVEILEICERIQPNTVARSAYRPVMQAAEKIGSLTGVATLSIAREAISAVETPLEALYEYVMTGKRHTEPEEVVPLETCIRDAINTVADFAQERGVDIPFNGTSRTEVSVRRVEVTRAIQNLLHNAIKYSWKRGTKAPWVSVAVGINQLAMAELCVENWGVPIPEEEIKEGLVFRLGFRGRFSSDRGRVGTGVGLADSMAIARAHSGSLRAESRPAAPHGNPRQYGDQPFITRMYLTLPLWRKSDGR